jgi:hypothetical protein
MPHLRVAASEQAIKKVFDKIVEKFVFEKADSKDAGPFTVAYDIKFHLKGGSIDLRPDNTVQVKELDVHWDRFNLSLGLDIPGLCVGGFCLIPIPFDGCLLFVPEFCVFEGDPDVELVLVLSPFGLVISEVSITGSLATRYHVNTDRPADMDQWEAQDADPELYNTWQLFLNPQTVDFDIVDVADTVGDLLDEAIEAAVDILLGPLPDVIKDLVEAVLGSLVDVIRAILDIGDDLQEWLMDLLDVTLGVVNIIVLFITKYFAEENPLYELEDPYPLLKKAPNPNDQPGQPPLPELVPVKIPIRDLTVFNNDFELVLEGSVG